MAVFGKSLGRGNSVSVKSSELILTQHDSCPYEKKEKESGCIQTQTEDPGRHRRQLPPVSQAEMPQKKLDPLTPRPRSKTSCPGSGKMIAKVACSVALALAPRAKHGWLGSSAGYL